MLNEKFWEQHPDIYRYIEKNYQATKDSKLSREIETKFGIWIEPESIRWLRRSEGWKKRGSLNEGISPIGETVVKRETTASDISEQDLRQVLSEKGYRVEKLTPDKMDITKKVDTSIFEGEKIKFGVISCSHLASKFQQLTHLQTYYARVQEQGIKLVFHCGDVVAGMKVYKGQEYELFLHGVKAQREYAIEHYPRMTNGGKTIMIAGNHDYSFHKEAGCDIVEDIANEREDIEYWGAYGAYPILPRLKIYIQHASGGVPYAISYRLQKNIEQFSPDAKPDIYFMGHLHKSCALFQYRNVTAFSMPCFESQTPYLRRKGLYPEIGGLIIEFCVNDRGRKNNLARMKFEWIPFYKPIEKDY